MHCSQELAALVEAMKRNGANTWARELERVNVGVRRMERTLDEITSDAQEQDALDAEVEAATLKGIASGVIVVPRFGRIARGA